MKSPLITDNETKRHQPARHYRCIGPLIVFLLFIILLAILLTAVIIFRFGNVQRFSNRPPLILVSMDGFRHDYLEKVRAAGGRVDNFDYLIGNGVRAMQVKNVFPTITLPNHHTLVTGLYPESSGIVLNSYIDPKFPGEMFEMNNQTTMNQAKWFTDWPEPIWVTCQRAGCLTASNLWPLTDAPIRNDLPFQQVSEFTILDGEPARYPYDKRVDDVIWWLTNPRYHIDLVLLYFDEPDETGHSYGPNSQEVFDVVRMLDGYVGYMIQRMRAVGILDQVDMIITADHGMSEISTDRVIILDQFVNSSLYTYTLLTPVGTLYPNAGYEQYVYSRLKGAHPHMQVWWRQDVPSDLNYNLNNGRIAPLILLADNGWSIWQSATTTKTPRIGGNHGYNNSEPDVHPFLIAHGPSFKVNYTTPMVQMVDIYPLMCSLLGIRPNPNNGSLGRIANLLKSTAPLGHYWGSLSLVTNVWVWAVLLVLLLLLVVQYVAVSARRRHLRQTLLGAGAVQ